MIVVSRAYLLFLFLLIAILLYSPQALAKTYEVDSLSDFENAIQHATDGDTILFTDDVTIDFAYLDSFHYSNDNNNGQYYDQRQWDIEGITLMIMAEDGVTAKIKNGGIRLYNAEGTVINNIVFENSYIWVLNDSDAVTITDNQFINSYIEVNQQSDDYVIQDNIFQGGEGIYIYDTSGTMEDAVTNNFLNSLPIIYLQGDQCSVSGGDYGQIVAVNCNGLNIEDMVLTSNTTPRAYKFIILSNVDHATISGIKINQVPYSRYIIELYKSNDITITDSELTNTTIYAEDTTGLNIIDNKFTMHDYEAITSWENAKDIRIENNEFTFYDTVLYLANGENLWIKGNTFNHAASIWGIELRNFNNTYIQDNLFTSADPEKQWRSGELYVYISNNKEGIHTLEITGNTFTTTPYYNDDERQNYMAGVSITAMSDITIENNTFTWLDSGISLKNVTNVLIQNNTLMNNFYSIELSGGQGTVSKDITVKNNLINNTRYGIKLNRKNLNTTITGNIFMSPPTHQFYNYYIKFYYARDYNVSIYMNAFLNLTEDNKAIDYTESDLVNDTFRSPSQTTYTYNGRMITGYVGNYYDNYNGTDNNNDGIGDTPYLVYKEWWPEAEVLDEYPLISINIFYAWTGASQPQGGQEGGQDGQTVSQEESGGNETMTIPIEMTPEKRMLFNEARELDQKLDEYTLNMTGTNPDELNDPEKIRKLLNETGIENLIKEMHDKGLIREIIRLPPQGTQQLRELLEQLYGPLLVNYPDPMGRIYLLYTLYYLE